MAATYSSLVGLAVGGKYEIRRVLGAGGMGVVCEAVHLDLGKRVAVKLIDKSMKESELIVARFRREARAAGQINSEHIVDVFDVGADARVGLYMVMELLQGEDLQSRLERERKLEPRTMVMIAHQIARGLAKAHEAGIIHRDLKPANVYLTERDSGQMLVKLLDFGVSKLLLEEQGNARITGTGSPIGTPLYMAPEQAEGKDDVDGRADLWSLGALMYEALAGAPPFADRGSYHGTIIGILTSRPRLLKDAAPWVPPEICAVVDAMLVHDKNARIPNAQALTQRLLDAYPTVLPDGTGKHTAVIVSQATGAIDATGDTEVFDAAAFARASRTAPSTDPGRRPSTPPPMSQRDARTLADGEPVGRASESLQTGAATSYAGYVPTPPPVSVRAKAKTEPLPPSTSFTRSPVSSGGGMSVTPASLDPLPPSLPTPPPARRPMGTLAVIGVIIVVVAVGGFLVGRRASPPPSPAPVVSASAVPVATSAAPPPVTSASATAAEPMPPPPPTGVTASAPPSAPPPKKRRPKPAPKPVDTTATEDPPAATTE